jgi:hypothetical protein
MTARWKRYAPECLILLAFILVPAAAMAHGIGGKDAAFVATTNGAAIVPFIYLGAKHMVTGYDHLLFIAGVVFFLYRLTHVAIYVTMFSIGHSITLLLGVLGGLHVNPYLVDAVIGLSVAYKALDNLGAYQTLFGFQPNTKLAVLGFGLVHGFGLATKVQTLKPPTNGLVVNMLSFNVGVELGQLLALSVILALIVLWRRTPSFAKHAVAANVAILTAGFALTEFQLIHYFTNGRL